jgi:hypothetical protein
MFLWNVGKHAAYYNEAGDIMFPWNVGKHAAYYTALRV